MAEQLSYALLKWMNLVSRTIIPATELCDHTECLKLVDIQRNVVMVQTLDQILCRSIEHEATHNEMSTSELLVKVVNDLEHIYDDLSDLHPSKDGEYSENQVNKLLSVLWGVR